MTEPQDEPRAATAGQQDHGDIDQFRGGKADPPRDPDAEIDDLEIEQVERGPDRTGSDS